MRMRHGLFIGLGVAFSAALPAIPHAVAQTASQPARSQPAAGKPAPSSAADPQPAAFGTSRIRTLTDALAASYANNPALQAERATLRATDEGVPQALSGWRPQVSMSGQAGYGDGYSRQWLGDGNTFVNAGRWNNARTQRTIGAASGNVTQPVYTGGKTRAALNKADNAVMAERARLIVAEQLAMTDTVTAYVNLIQAQQTLGLRVNNEQVLARQL